MAENSKSETETSDSKTHGSEIEMTEGEEQLTQDQLQELRSLAEEAQKFKHDFLYLRAEFDNYKRHAIKERSDLLKFGAERLVRDLLAGLDNFERALSMHVTSENYAGFVKGIEMTAIDLRSALQKHGINEIESQGQSFDPNLHEALGSEPSNEVPEGQVIKVFKKGYKYHEKVLRPSQVVISKASSSKEVN